MGNRNILVVGTSAGGVQALMALVKGLPADLPACVLVTIHLSREFRSSLDEILSQAGPLPAAFATDGAAVRDGHIFLAPADRHLLIEDGRLVLGRGPRENSSRPAIDPMMRSAAICCGHRCVAAVLTGSLGDGASGLWAVGQYGGSTVVQDPDDAAFAEMPRNAMNRATPQHVVTLADMPGLLTRLVLEPASEPMPVPDSLRYEVGIARGGERSRVEQMDRIGRRSALTCPDCHGAMWEIDEDDVVRFRCHVGHAYTAEVMGAALDDSLLRALASARRVLQERTELARKLCRQARDSDRPRLEERWRSEAEELAAEADVIDRAIRRLDWSA